MTPRGSAWTAHGQRWAPCTGHRSRRTTHTHTSRTTHTSELVPASAHARTAPHPHRDRYRSAKKFPDRDDISAFSSPIILVPIFSVRMNQFRGIFTPKMRLVRLFPDACNGDVTHYTTFWSVRGAILARSAAETRFARLRSG